MEISAPFPPCIPTLIFQIQRGTYSSPTPSKVKSDVFQVICNVLKLNIERVRKTPASNFSGEKQETETKSVVKGFYSDLHTTPDISGFYGRNKELEELETQIDNNQRLIVIWGSPGIGKTFLAVKLIHNFKSQMKFEGYIRKSLQHGTKLKELITDILEPLLNSEEKKKLYHSSDEGISQLIKLLKERNFLIILENWEAIMKKGELAGFYQEGYEKYKYLLQQLAQVNHNSCILITTSEEPKEIASLDSQLIYSFKLKGFSREDSKNLFNGNYSRLSSIKIDEIIDIYKGNPSAILMISNSIKSIFNYQIKDKPIEPLKGIISLEDWVKNQYESLSNIEKQILILLMLENGNTKQNNLLSQDITNIVTSDYSNIMNGINSLRRRSLIEVIYGDEILLELNSYILDYVLKQVIKSMLEIVSRDTVRILDTEFITKIPPTYLDIRKKLIQIIENKLTLSEKFTKITALTLSLKAGKK